MISGGREGGKKNGNTHGRRNNANTRGSPRNIKRFSQKIFL
jgi:hypothetical protein